MGHSKIWWALAAITLFLGANKIIQIQTLLVYVGRDATMHLGWYSARRPIQALFTGALLVASGFTAWKVARSQVTFVRTHFSLAAGLAVVTGYCLIRAAEINHICLFNCEYSTSGALWAIEAFGLGLMLCGSVKSILRNPSACR